MTDIERVNFHPGVILVTFVDGTSRELATEIAKAHGGKIKNWIGSPDAFLLAVINIPEGSETAKVEEFFLLPEVQSAGLNYQNYTC
jgi:hypothetical protein